MADPETDLLLQRQSLLVEFSARVGRGRQLQELLTAAAELAANALDVGCVTVLEWLPAEHCLLVRAGVGWNAGVIGHARLGADLESPAGFALKTDEAVMADDLRRERRFRTPELLEEHGVMSALDVIINTRDGAFGVLEADSRRLRIFTAADRGFLQGTANLLGLAIDRQRLSEQNAELLQCKDRLFREIQHRIKNSAQTLVSVMNLQLSRSEHEETRDALRSLMSRVEALNLLDSQVCLDGDIEHLALGRYLRELLGALFAFHGQAAGVRLKSDIAEVRVTPDQAKAVGLIVNEFVLNSFKHAFAAGGGTLSASLRRDGPTATLRLADTGPGLPAETATSGLGLPMIDALARQLGGSLRLKGPPGARLTLAFPLAPAGSAAP